MANRPYVTAIEYDKLLKSLGDLSKLPEEQLKHLAEVKWYQKCSARDGKIYDYLPQDHAGYQLDFAKSGKKIRLLLGGNRSGKTETGIAEDVWYCLGTHPFKKIRVPNNGWICSVDYGASREIAEQKFFSYFPKSQIKKWNITERVLTTKMGSTVGFKSYDSGATKFQGRSIDWIHMDEEPPKNIYNECMFRLIDTLGHCWITMTPTLGMSWVYDDLYESGAEDLDIFMFDMRWNRFLDKGEVDRMIAKMTDEEREMRVEGKFIQLSGLVYKDFKRDVHVVPPFSIPEEWSLYRSIDHGLNNPTCCLWGAVNKEDELYIYDEYYESGKEAGENADAIKLISSGDKYIWSIIDKSTDNDDPIDKKASVFKVYRDHGVYCKPSISGRGTKAPGINAVKERLHVGEKTKRPKLFIFSTCKATIKEIERYRWKAFRVGDDKNLSEEPQKVFDHAMDALRYLVASKPYYYDREMEEANNDPKDAGWYNWR